VGGTQFDMKNHPVDTANATTPICIGSGALSGKCAMGGYEIVSSTQTKSRITSGGVRCSGFARILHSRMLLSFTPLLRLKPLHAWEPMAFLSGVHYLLPGGTVNCVQTLKGFSNVADRPAYQDAAVKAYLPQINLNQRIYNSAGRGYPDIAALAHNYYIQINGDVGSEDGTSASSPVMGGLMGLINAHRKRANRPAVGFVRCAFSTEIYARGCRWSRVFTPLTGWHTKLRPNTEGQPIALRDHDLCHHTDDDTHH
jgi:hypothetical protein